MLDEKSINEINKAVAKISDEIEEKVERYIAKARLEQRKLIKMSDIDLDICTGTTMYVTIDIFKFIADEQLECVEIQMDENGEWKFFDEAHASVTTHDDLRKFALNWIFNNVEITVN